MKRIIILVVLVALAAIAGVVARSSSGGELRELVSHSKGDVREEIREKFELAPGAQVELASLNGAVKIETSDTRTAEVYIERIAPTQEALDRRGVTIQATANSLTIRGEKRRRGFFARLFGSNASERVTLKLPRNISLSTKGVNGSVVAGNLDGSVEISGINGRVEIASAAGTATFKGVNGNILVGLKRLDQEGITLSGINGNIELQLAEGVNADLETKGMNGRVVSELPNVSIDKSKHGHYSARIGTGGSSIYAKGINGNIRLTRTAEAATTTAAATTGN